MTSNLNHFFKIELATSIDLQYLKIKPWEKRTTLKININKEHLDTKDDRKANPNGGIKQECDY